MAKQLLQAIQDNYDHVNVEDKILLQSKAITKEEVKKLQDKYDKGLSDKQMQDEFADHWAADIARIRKEIQQRTLDEGDFDTEPLTILDIYLKKKKFCTCICLTKIVPIKYVVSYKSEFKKKWDLFILVTAIYNSF